MIRKLLNTIIVLATMLTMAVAQSVATRYDGELAKLASLEEGSPAYNSQQAKAHNMNQSLIKALGENWRDLWTTEGAKNDDDLIDHYIAGNEIPLQVAGSKFSLSKKRELLDYIAAKEEVTMRDLHAYKFVNIFDGRIFARLSDFAALNVNTSIKGQKYFILKHEDLGRSKSYVEVMTLSEWFEMASANSVLSVSAYNDMRSGILSSVAQAIINQRAEENIDIKSEEFNTLVSGVRAALAAPLFEGLKEAVDALEIGLVIPEGVDFSDQVAVANNSKTLIERKIENVKPAELLGSIMFVLGETSYDQWRISVVTPQ
jgi:hypothetical protein